MSNFKITKTILENINEQNDRINECVDIVNGYTTDEETRVNQELQRQQNEVERQEQYHNNENRFNEISTQLETVVNIRNDFYDKSKSGKKIVFVGDSTTEQAVEMFERLNELSKTGGILEGATFINRGSSGNTIQRFIQGLAYNSNTITKVIEDQADLYVFCYGINDIRGGVDSPGHTKDVIRNNIKIAIDKILNETKAYILLRTPNTFLNKEYGEQGKEFLDDVKNAQKHVDDLWEIYESFRGYNNRVDVIDIQSKVFGREVKYQHSFMKDTLHPNGVGYTMIAEVISEHITNFNSDFSSLKVDKYGVIIDVKNNTFEVAFDEETEINEGDYLIIGKVKYDIPKTFNRYSRLYNHSSSCNTFEFEKTVDVNKYGIIRLVKKTIDIETNSDWKRYNFSAIDKNTVQLEYVIDVGKFVNSNDFSFEFEYYVDTSTNLSSISPAYCFNNSSNYNDVGGGLICNDVIGATVWKNVNHKYFSHVSFDKQNYSQLHLLVQLIGKNIGNGYIDIRRPSIKIGNDIFDLSEQIANIRMADSGNFEVIKDTTPVTATTDYVVNTLNDKIINSISPKWVYLKQNKSNTEQIQCVASVIDASKFVGLNNVKIRYTYNTKDERITHIYPQLNINNSDSDIYGGLYEGFDVQNCYKNGYFIYSSSKQIDFSLYKKIHLLINCPISSSGNNFEIGFGDIELFIGSEKIDLNNNDWINIGTFENGSITVGYKKENLVTYDVLLKELAKYQKL